MSRRVLERSLLNKLIEAGELNSGHVTVLRHLDRGTFGGGVFVKLVPEVQERPLEKRRYVMTTRGKGNEVRTLLVHEKDIEPLITHGFVTKGPILLGITNKGRQAIESFAKPSVGKQLADMIFSEKLKKLLSRKK